ncbi:SPFH domain-containing protein [Ralstonia pseudosolanacearum]|uniref:SPFH domain-containing protein n=1 Tax=Ralstonia pseudosolanacearum TaxID=1310165 RepID=UPI0018D09E30|nr:SPFH domain-containing protein [Ralstonia pseudosolanacearum]
MSLSSFIKKQFIDILQWTESDDGVLAWRYPMQDMEIQNGGSLTVRDSQMAMFVNEGQIADVFGAGMFKLNTHTLPVLTYLKNWDKLFESPFKSDVYFFSTRQQLGRRWGTPQPVTVRDKDFGMVRLRAFGVYAYHVADPKLFYQQVSGTRDLYTVDDMEQQFGPVIMGAMATAFGESGVPFVDLAANQTLLSNKVREALLPQFTQYGLALDSFQVSSVTLPDELQAALDRRISMDMTGDMQRFTQYQTAESLPLAARNEGGFAGTGAGLTAGMVLGQTMAENLRTSLQGNAGAAPAAQPAAPVAPVAPAADDPAARLAKLKELLDKGLITQADFDAGKAAVLKALTGGAG